MPEFFVPFAQDGRDEEMYAAWPAGWLLFIRADEGKLALIVIAPFGCRDGGANHRRCGSAEVGFDGIRARNDLAHDSAIGSGDGTDTISRICAAPKETFCPS